MIEFSGTLDIVLFVIELIGCIAFATSGSIIAIRKKVDILGVFILTMISVFGGGLLRDLIMNKGVPHIFYDPLYFILAGVVLIVSLTWFLIAYFDKTCSIIEKHRNDFIIYLVDALGTAVFCVYGVDIAFSNLPSDISGTFPIYIYVVSLGVITGLGGSIFRDVFIGQMPTIFKKHFYLTPCILGTLVYAIMTRTNCNKILSLIISIGIITLLRALATIYKWNLPSAKGYNKLLNEEENKKINELENKIIEKINNK